MSPCASDAAMIAVAVSGGMDSLLALALLAEAGERVLAVHGHFLPPDAAALARADALEAQCARLGLPFAAYDLSAAFEALVVAPFVAAYAAGRTPNPCAACNRAMKFGLLFAAARESGAARLATGHYARALDHPRYGRVLARGADPAKEQSYFLSLLPREVLAQAVFPLGGWLKRDVPAALAARGLNPPLPAESQEICFVPGDDYKAFMAGRPEPLPGPGPIVLADGRVIGQHQGLWRHTVGQRKGLGIPWAEPLYVLAKDAATNALVAGPAAALRSAGCLAGGVNVLVPPELWPEEVLARTRYRKSMVPARAEVAGEILRIRFREPQEPPAPGQVAALYDGEGVVLAAGIISEARPAD